MSSSSAAASIPAPAPHPRAGQVMSGAEMIIRALKEQGVDTIFGYPGGAVLPIYDALYAEQRLTHVLVRHDSHVLPLALLYNGPYAVLRWSLHTFTIQMGDREEVVSMGHLKPCRTPHVVPAQQCGGSRTF